MLKEIDLLSHETVRDPYSYVNALREETSVGWNERHRAWFITRYEDVSAAFREPALSSDRISPYRKGDHNGAVDDGLQGASTDEIDAQASPFEHLSRWMVFNDPPDHTRLRRLVNKGFTPRTVEGLRGRIGEIVEELVEELRDKGEADIVRDLAYPLPAIVIAEMLGVPTEDRGRFKDWSEDILVLVFGAKGEGDRHERARRGLLELSEYFRELVAQYRDKPAENLISALVTAGDKDDALSEDEIVATCTLLLFGGHETTTNLIGNGTLALLENPDQRDRLRREPDLRPAAVEEFLRYDGPSKLAVRYTVDECQFGQTRIGAGQRVFLIQAAANRDPRRFDNPDTLDLGRTDNKHVGFGFGIHYCLGAPLARLEAQIAFGTLLEKLENIEPAAGELCWHETILSRGLETLPVKVS